MGELLVGAALMIGGGVLFYALIMFLIAINGPYHPAERREYEARKAADRRRTLSPTPHHKEPPHD